MKLFLLIIGLALVAAKEYEPINNHYHATVGIPTAERIKRAEAARDFDGSRIIGGQLSSLGAHPHLAGLITSLGNNLFSSCGASLLSNTRLVSAAHCWRDDEHQGISMEVVLGSLNLFSGGTRIITDRVELHANYNTRNLNNDIAIITIPWVSYSDIISSIALPTGFFEILTYEGIIAVTAGYGRTVNKPAPNENSSLRHVSMVVLENWECVNVYGPDVVISSTLCSAYYGVVGICDGDSGGSLAVNFGDVRYLIGVTSFTAQASCGVMPSGFVRVTSFVNWIQARL